MEIDERIVVEIPPSMRDNRRRKPHWIKRNVIKALLEVRNRIGEETGEDIFNLFVMDDCIEITIKGQLESSPFERIRTKRKAPPLKERGRLKILSYDGGSRRRGKQR